MWQVVSEFEADAEAAADATPETDERGPGVDDEPIIYTGIAALAPLRPRPH